MDPLLSAILGIAPDIRYASIYRNGVLSTAERPGLHAASSAESDRYEELLVNPTLLTLTRQRGEIDCGGLEFVLIRYGSFFQFVLPTGFGHVSVAIEPHADPLALAAPIRAAVRSASSASPVG